MKPVPAPIASYTAMTCSPCCRPSRIRSSCRCWSKMTCCCCCSVMAILLRNVGPDVRSLTGQKRPADLGIASGLLVTRADALGPGPQDYQAGQDALVGLDAEPLGVGQNRLQEPESPPGVFLQAGPRVERSALTPSAHRSGPA